MVGNLRNQGNQGNLRNQGNQGNPEKQRKVRKENNKNR